VKDLGKQICEAVEVGKLDEPFNAAMIRAACPGWADRDYHIALTEHVTGNGRASELFERVSFGLYRLIPSQSEASTEHSIEDQLTCKSSI
jgi:hypothetical protein